MSEPRHDDSPNDAPGPTSIPPPELVEALRELGATSRSGFAAAGDAAKALRTLVAADLSLARSALGRALAYTGMAIAFGASAWLLLMAAAVALAVTVLGWPWPLALGLAALLSLAVTALGGWQAVRHFEHTRLQATRRQLARLGIGELADFVPEPGSPESTRDAAPRSVAVANGNPPAKDARGIDVTPP